MSSSSSSYSSSSFYPPDNYHHHQTNFSSSDQLCYVHCNFCNTLLAVSVPSSSLFKTVTVRCGHCTNLLIPVNMRALLVPPPAQLSSLNHHQTGLMSPPARCVMEEEDSIGMQLPSLNTMNMTINSINKITAVISGQQQGEHHQTPTTAMPSHQLKRVDEMNNNVFSKHHTSVLAVNRPPEKRQRVPSAYNRFIREEIQRIKAGNPNISHREAFSAAAKNWAHFPSIHFGLMPDDQKQPPMGKKPNLLQNQRPLLEEADDTLRNTGLFATANFGVSHY